MKYHQTWRKHRHIHTAYTVYTADNADNAYHALTAVLKINSLHFDPKKANQKEYPA